MTSSDGQTPVKTLPIPGEIFQTEGCTAFLILPNEANREDSIPWVWYAPTLKQYPGAEEKWMFDQFLAKGIAITGVDVGESYGSPTGRKVFSALYSELVNDRGLAKKANLLARSRGGLMLYAWAAENPQCVNSIAGIYPVCNIASYPGLSEASGAYDMTEEELTHQLHKHNPIDTLAPLAAESVPIFHVHGDNDEIVPLEKNSALLASRYKQLGGTISLEVVKDGGHDMSPSWFHNQDLVDFVIARVSQSKSN